MVKYVNFKSGKKGVETEYNGSFVKELKQLVPSARWQKPYWVFDPISETEVKNLVTKYWPSEEKLQRVKITWEFDRDNPTIDDTNLAYVSRDSWKWRADCPVSFRVLESNIKSGGSRNYPGLYGTCIIEAKIRSDAKILPIPENIEVIENGKEHNPLEQYSDDDILVEAKRRGLI